MKKERILSAAEELFAEKGFTGTSVRDISKRAKVNIAMINYYFGSKENLMKELATRNAAYAAGFLEDLVNRTELTPYEKLKQWVSFYVDKIFGSYRFHNILSRQMSLFTEDELKSQLIQIKLKNFNLVKDLVVEGQQKGDFRTDIDLEFTVATFVGTVSQITLSREFYKTLMGRDVTTEEFLQEVSPRLKRHLTDLLTHHLLKEKQNA